MTLCHLLCWRGSGSDLPAAPRVPGSVAERPSGPAAVVTTKAPAGPTNSWQDRSNPVHEASHADKQDQELQQTQTQVAGEQEAWVPRPSALLGEAWGASAGPGGAAGQGPSVVGLQLRALIREVVLGDFLGAGYSGGKVFRATWRGSTVALKLMVSSDLDQLRLTTREALLSRTLSHPHLVQTYALSISQLTAEDLAPETYAPPPRVAGAAGGRGYGGGCGGDSFGPGAGISTAANALLATSLLQTMSPMLAMAAEGSGRGGEVGPGAIMTVGGGRADAIADLDELPFGEPPARLQWGAGTMASSGSRRRVPSGLGLHQQQLTPPQNPLLLAALRAGGGSGGGGGGSNGGGFARVSVSNALTGIPEPLEGEAASGDCPGDEASVSAAGQGGCEGGRTAAAGVTAPQEGGGGTISLVGTPTGESAAVPASGPGGWAAYNSRRSSSHICGSNHSRSRSSLTSTPRGQQVLSAAVARVVSESPSAGPANRRMSTSALGAATATQGRVAGCSDNGEYSGAGAALAAASGPGGASYSSTRRMRGPRRVPSLGAPLTSASSAPAPTLAEAGPQSVPAGAGIFPSAFSTVAAGPGRCSDLRGSGSFLNATSSSAMTPAPAAVALSSRAGSGGLPHRHGSGGRCASLSRLSQPSAPAASTNGVRVSHLMGAANGVSFRHRGSGNLRTVLERAASQRAFRGADVGASSGRDGTTAPDNSPLTCIVAASNAPVAPSPMLVTADLQSTCLSVEPPSRQDAALRCAAGVDVDKSAATNPGAAGSAELLTSVGDAEVIAAGTDVPNTGTGAGHHAAGGAICTPSAHQPLLHSTATITSTTDDELFPLTLRELAADNLPAAVVSGSGRVCASACSGSTCGGTLVDAALEPPRRQRRSGAGAGTGGVGAAGLASARPPRSHSSPDGRHVGAGAGSDLRGEELCPTAVTSFTAEAATGAQDARQHQLDPSPAALKSGKQDPDLGGGIARDGGVELAVPGNEVNRLQARSEPVAGVSLLSRKLADFATSASPPSSPSRSLPPPHPPPPASAPACSQRHPEVSGGSVGAGAGSGTAPGAGGLHVLHWQQPLVTPFYKRPSMPQHHGSLSRGGTQDSALLNSHAHNHNMHNNMASGWPPLTGLGGGGMPSLPTGGGLGHGTASQVLMDIDAAAAPGGGGGGMGGGGGGVAGPNSSMVLFSETRIFLSPQLPPLPPPQADPEIVRFLTELVHLGAAPGRYLTAVIMELCDRGTMLAYINNQQAAKVARQERLSQQQQVQGSSGKAAGANPSGLCASSPFTQPLQQASTSVTAAEAEALVVLRRGMLLPPPSNSAVSVDPLPAQQEEPGPNSGGSATGADDSAVRIPTALSAASGVTSPGPARSPGPGGGSAQLQKLRRQGAAGSGGGMSVEGLEQLQNALEVAQALAHLHTLDLVHGDLKPANVLLRASAPLALGGGAWGPGDLGLAFGLGTATIVSDVADGSGGSNALPPLPARGYIVKVADFGLTSPVASADGLPKSTNGSGWGALPYLAPEVVTAGRHGKPADVYSYGALLWHMCSGVPPHSQLHPAQILVGLAGGELQLEWPADAEPTLRKIGAACLQHDPAARPSFDRIVRALIKAVEKTVARSRSRPFATPAGATAAAAAASNLPSAAHPAKTAMPLSGRIAQSQAALPSQTNEWQEVSMLRPRPQSQRAFTPQALAQALSFRASVDSRLDSRLATGGDDSVPAASAGPATLSAVAAASRVAAAAAAGAAPPPRDSGLGQRAAGSFAPSPAPHRGLVPAMYRQWIPPEAFLISTGGRDSSKDHDDVGAGLSSSSAALALLLQSGRYTIVGAGGGGGIAGGSFEAGSLSSAAAAAISSEREQPPGGLSPNPGMQYSLGIRPVRLTASGDDGTEMLTGCGDGI